MFSQLMHATRVAWRIRHVAHTQTHIQYRCAVLCSNICTIHWTGRV